MVSLISLLGFIIVLVWLGFVTYYQQKSARKYKLFTGGVQRKTLETVLINLFEDVKKAKKDIANLSTRCDTIETSAKFHIQKIGLLRFNPFKDMGGDQSFILSLVDTHDTGVVITALYSRSGTRWYAKRVVNGKGSEHELSDEEKKAVKMAKEYK